MGLEQRQMGSFQSESNVLIFRALISVFKSKEKKKSEVFAGVGILTLKPEEK